MRRLFVFSLFLFPLILGQLMMRRSVLSEGVHSICNLVAQHFYKVDLELGEWVGRCRSQADWIMPWHRQSEVVERLQVLMDDMQVSHFQIYTPSEDTKIWKGEAVDTGIRARWVEDRLVVFRVLKDSGAARAGIAIGDDIVQIDGAENVSPFRAENTSGEYVLRRSDKELKVNVVATPLRVDEGPSLTQLNGRVGLLSISSFRAEYFQGRDWLRIVEGLPRFEKIIIDVRKNAGGNFVAMLRALSPFMCGARHVGTLVQPRKRAPVLTAIADETNDEFQIAELDKYSSIQLRTYGNYGCYQGSVTVLVDSDTASVSEIFAEAMRARANTRVWGQPSAGDVVLAVWYDLPLFGQGYSISVPEAVFLTIKGDELEGRGVWPDKELYYDLSKALRGVDNWLEEAGAKSPKTRRASANRTEGVQ